uniref:Uncharacterized protein n=1 Tax=Leersia perrieri TaxID=77586 RepID=A0A0D9XZ50_9ORYZ
MATARGCSSASSFSVRVAEEVLPPETRDVVRRQRQLLRRAAELCLDPIAEEDDSSSSSISSSCTGAVASRRQSGFRIIN